MIYWYQMPCILQLSLDLTDSQLPNFKLIYFLQWNLKQYLILWLCALDNYLYIWSDCLNNRIRVAYNKNIVGGFLDEFFELVLCYWWVFIALDLLVFYLSIIVIAQLGFELPALCCAQHWVYIHFMAVWGRIGDWGNIH